MEKSYAEWDKLDKSIAQSDKSIAEWKRKAAKIRFAIAAG
jgi:hypothetical protein